MFGGLLFLLKYTWKFEKKYVIYSLLNQILSGCLLVLNLIIPKFLIDELTIGKKWK